VWSKLIRQVKSGNLESQPMPHNHAKNLCTYHSATPETVQAAIDGALKAKPEWEDMPWADRAAIFLKAADLIAGKYRFEVMAATMMGQGKNAWQAEIDAAAEVNTHLGDGRIELMGRLLISCDSASSTSSNCTLSNPQGTLREFGTELNTDLLKVSFLPSLHSTL
jgi:acyl-CoA reductase-like NAD-dependent aldehyde dehydrogenase